MLTMKHVRTAHLGDFVVNFTHEFNALSTENRSISCIENPSRIDKSDDILQETQRTLQLYV